MKLTDKIKDIKKSINENDDYWLKYKYNPNISANVEKRYTDYYNSRHEGVADYNRIIYNNKPETLYNNAKKKYTESIKNIEDTINNINRNLRSVRRLEHNIKKKLNAEILKYNTNNTKTISKLTYSDPKVTYELAIINKINEILADVGEDEIRVHKEPDDIFIDSEYIEMAADRLGGVDGFDETAEELDNLEEAYSEFYDEFKDIKDDLDEMNDNFIEEFSEEQIEKLKAKKIWKTGIEVAKDRSIVQLKENELIFGDLLSNINDIVLLAEQGGVDPLTGDSSSTKIAAQRAANEAQKAVNSKNRILKTGYTKMNPGQKIVVDNKISANNAYASTVARNMDNISPLEEEKFISDDEYFTVLEESIVGLDEAAIKDLFVKQRIKLLQLSKEKATKVYDKRIETLTKQIEKLEDRKNRAGDNETVKASIDKSIATKRNTIDKQQENKEKKNQSIQDKINKLNGHNDVNMVGQVEAIAETSRIPTSEEPKVTAVDKKGKAYSDDEVLSKLDETAIDPATKQLHPNLTKNVNYHLDVDNGVLRKEAVAQAGNPRAEEIGLEKYAPMLFAGEDGKYLEALIKGTSVGDVSMLENLSSNSQAQLAVKKIKADLKKIGRNTAGGKELIDLKLQKNNFRQAYNAIKTNTENKYKK